MQSAIHFVGFIHPNIGCDDRRDYAARIFGNPDFIHRHWDRRAMAEIAPGDIVVFANGTEADEPRKYSYDDSDNQ